MRLYEGMIPTIASDLADALVEEEVIEISDLEEFKLDIEAVLREYVRMDRELMDQARDMSADRGGRGNLYKIKRRLARKKNFEIGEESVEYIIQQLIETFFHTHHVVEVFGADNELRRTMAPVLKKHMDKEEELDQEVRSKIKNLEEGSRTWDIEYQKVMERLKHQKNLE